MEFERSGEKHGRIGGGMQLIRVSLITLPSHLIAFVLHFDTSRT
jgi:hypothetical protein